MNNTTRVILLSLLSVAVLAGCKTKATKDNTCLLYTSRCV